MRLIGLARVATGVWFLVDSRRSAAIWTADDGPAVRAMVTSVGARDAAIGAGLAATPSIGWLAASMVSDVVDGVAARVLPPDRRRSTRRLAFGFALIGALGASTFRPRAGTRGRPDREVR